MDFEKTIEAVDVLVQDMDEQERPLFFEHLRTAYPQEMGVVAVSGAEEELPAFETGEVVEAIETEAKGETWDVFEPPEAIERRERATRVTTALAEKFKRPESDFSVINSTNEAGENICAVALTATERLDLGDSSKTYDPKRNWNKVTAKDNDSRFIIKVDGQKVDTRESQNMQWLKAVAAANPEINEWVWRTGEKEKADRDGAPLASLCVGQADASQYYRPSDYWSTGFRPVVVI